MKSEVPTYKSQARGLCKNRTQWGYRGRLEGNCLTAMQKNKTKKPISKSGISSQPTPLNTAKNPIWIGTATTKSDPMTSLRLGFLLLSFHLFGGAKVEGRADMTQ